MMIREAEMYGPLEDHFAARGMIVLREVTTYQGRIDVLAIRLDERACDERRELGIGSVAAPNLIRLWAALPPRLPVSRLVSFAERLAVQPATLRSHLRALAERGVVVEESAAWKRVARPFRIAREIVCCEAKLSDWQSVVRQAYGHRFYAHRSFVALHRVPRTLDVSLLEKRRLGLIRVSGEGVRRDRPAPVTRPPDTLASVYLQERTWELLSRPRARSLRAATCATA